MKGKIEQYLINKIKNEGAIHLSLLDPVNVSFTGLKKIIEDINNVGSSGIMVGGSTLADAFRLREFVAKIKEYTKLPVILFPNNVSSIVPNVDAIWFMSLLNSTNPYYITGAQMLGAPLIKQYKLEALPMGYIVLGDGGTVALVGEAKPIPFEKPELILAYALVACYFGMRFVYLEAGSGACSPIPPSIVSCVKKNVPEITLVVGGGIKRGGDAYRLVESGADIIVTGTIVEDEELRVKRLNEIVKAVKKAGKKRLTQKISHIET